MAESRYHLGLKKIARETLERENFIVREEYPVRISGKSYNVDIVGLQYKNGEIIRRIAVECGECPDEKYDKLNKIFDEVRLFDFREMRDYFATKLDPSELTKLEEDTRIKVQKIQDELELYKEAFSKLKEDYDGLQRKWNNISRIQESPHKKKKILQLRCREKTILLFRKFVIENNYNSQEEALRDLLRLSDVQTEILGTKVDMSVAPIK